MDRMTLDKALTIIEDLERENSQLKKELEYYKNRKTSGRKKHNDKWMADYNKFATIYENSNSIDEVAKKCGISRRTAYRFKAYYNEIHGEI